VGAERYGIGTLDLPGLDVWFSIAGSEVRGYLFLTPSGRPRYRIYVTENGRRHTQDLPRSATPDLWRPAVAWPEPLPAPAVLTKPVAWQSPPVPQRTAEPPEPVAGWPYPNLRLGRAGTPPKTVQEAEARILRAIRTRWVQERDTDLRGPTALWPKDLMVAAAVVEKNMRASPTRKLAGFRPEDYEQVFVDESDLRARPARWVPEPRDVSDYEWRPNGPLYWPVPWSKHLFSRRSAMPVWTFGQIADDEGLSESEVIEIYAEACQTAFERAQR
jgi:hypothetical protein